MTAWRTFMYFACFVLLFLVASVQLVEAVNIGQYSNTITDSAPSAIANHTYRFTPKVDIGPGAYIEITLPADFTLTNASTTFEPSRNVELFINGVPRTASTSSGAGFDGVAFVRGAGGQITYTLGSDISIAADSQLELRVGNNTTGSLGVQSFFSTSTGTTTTPADIKPIQNSATLGLHEIPMVVVDGSQIANTDFLIFLNERVTVGPVDTTETIPPFRFNGSPTSTVGGTTLNVEISVETDEFAICKFDTVPGTDFALQPTTFSNTGLLQHSTIVAVTPNTVAIYYVRCIDDEGNFNITDYIISFTVNDIPTGTANTEGDSSGDGSGTGDSGTGSGDGGGGTSGSADGIAPLEGNQEGTGGDGGGGGGGSGGGSGSSAGGGFESENAPFQSGDGRVTISGYAYPGARVTVLVDGQVAESASANSLGAYSILIDEIARGAYTFGVFAEDAEGERSSTFSTSFTVTGARSSRLSNINIAPSITINPDPAEPGETVTISGFALPDATVTVQVSRADGTDSTVLTALSDSDGEWSSSLDTTGFARGTYRARADAGQVDGRESGFSDYEFFGLGQEADLPLSPDLNRDGFVNLIDFSILLFWWQSNGGDSDPPADINQDGNVSLTDFSILLFNWTG